MRKRSQVPDIFTPDGFVAGQMIVHALEGGGDDVEKMVSSLEGWSFEGPKGKLEIRGIGIVPVSAAVAEAEEFRRLGLRQPIAVMICGKVRP